MSSQLAAAAVAFAQQPNTPDNYYAPEDDARVGQRFVTQLQAKVASGTEPRLDQIGNRLAAHDAQFRYRLFVFGGGQPYQDRAPAGGVSCRLTPGPTRRGYSGGGRHDLRSAPIAVAR